MKIFIRCVVAVLPLVCQTTLFAQEWPNRTVRIVLPSPPGGGPDSVTRMVAERLSKTWQQPIVIENKPGGSTRIGAETVANSAPDGYSLLSTYGTHTMVKSLFSDTKYDPIGDFQAVVPFVRTEVVLVVNAESPYQTLDELVTAYKKQGRPLPYAHFGNGSTFHIYGLLLGQHAGIQMLPVAYKGEALQLNDLLGKQIESSFNSVSTALPQIRAGKVRALAIIGSARSSVLANVPTFPELGYSRLSKASWFGLLAPAKTPKPIIDKINADVVKILADPEIAKNLRERGLEPAPSSPAEFQASLNEEVPMWSKMVKEFGIKGN